MSGGRGRVLGSYEPRAASPSTHTVVTATVEPVARLPSCRPTTCPSARLLIQSAISGSTTVSLNHPLHHEVLPCRFTIAASFSDC